MIPSLQRGRVVSWVFVCSDLAMGRLDGKDLYGWERLVDVAQKGCHVEELVEWQLRKDQ